MKNKILLVSPSNPFSIIQNGVTKINRVLCFTFKENFDILTLRGPNDHGNYPETININFIETNKISKLLIILKWLFSKKPYFVCMYDNFGTSYLDYIIKNHHKYMIFHLSTPFIADKFINLPDHIKSKVRFYPIDSYSLLFSRRSEVETNFIYKIIFYYESIKWINFERKFYNCFNKVFFVSDVDSCHVNRLLNNNKCRNIPNGVDSIYFDNFKSIVYPKKTILFVGDYSYAPNEDAALYLLQSILPLLNCLDNLHVTLAGKNPTSKMMKYISCKVDIPGFVPNLSEVMDDHCIFLSVLRFGSGIKNKILEAMASGMIVLGTPISFDGIKNQDNYDSFIISENPEIIVNKIKYVINNFHNLNYIRSNANNLICEHYRWDAICKSYYSSYLET